MPTGLGSLTAIFTAACVAAARLFGIFELYLVAAAAAALLVACVIFVVLNRRSIVAERVVPDRLHVGDIATISVTVRNRRPLVSPVVHLVDHVDGQPMADAFLAPMSRHRPIQASYRVPAARRGPIDVGPLSVRVADPFELARSSRRAAPTVPFLVLPKLDAVAPAPKPPGRLALLPDRTSTRISPNGDEFSALRSYVTGDDLRKVHWPSTARLGDLVVRTDSISEHGRTAIVLDTRAHVADPETFEAMVSAAASLAWAEHQAGESVAVFTGSRASSDNKNGNCDTIFEHLALVTQVDSTPPAAALVGGDAQAAVVITGVLDNRVAAVLPGGVNTTLIHFGSGTAGPATSTGRHTDIAAVISVGPREFAQVWAEHAGAPPLAASSQAAP